MATIGIGIALWHLPLVIGSSLLLFGNFFALLLSIITVFYFKGLKPQLWYKFTARKLIKKSLTILTISVIILALPLSIITYQQMIKEKPKDIVRRIYRNQFGDQLENRLFSIKIEEKEVDIILYTPANTDEHYFKLLTKKIKKELGNDYQVIFEVIPTRRIKAPINSS